MNTFKSESFAAVSTIYSNKKARIDCQQPAQHYEAVEQHILAQGTTEK
jgi:hypothetical protein